MKSLLRAPVRTPFCIETHSWCENYKELNLKHLKISSSKNEIKIALKLPIEIASGNGDLYLELSFGFRFTSILIDNAAITINWFQAYLEILTSKKWWKIFSNAQSTQSSEMKVSSDSFLPNSGLHQCSFIRLRSQWTEIDQSKDFYLEGSPK